MTIKTEDRRLVGCPRSHQSCGWCGDYRHHHGTMRLPGASGRKNRYCTIEAMHPDKVCEVCGTEETGEQSSRRVWRSTTSTFEKVSAQ